jgi:hypothetical protein
VPAFDGAVLHGIGHLQAGYDFTGREYLDLELAAGDVADGLRGGLGRAKDRVERLREARCATPLDGRRTLRERRGGTPGQNAGKTRVFKEGTTFHGFLLVGMQSGEPTARTSCPPFGGH